MTTSDMAMPYIRTNYMLDHEVRRGSAEMLILALVEDRARHGYEIAKLIEQPAKKPLND